ncbi:hypothetical protein LF887_13940 [Chryseobacterium sp. MEBOG06]|uniref:hypothetical protein n=1 Tax=Chryseobacterium sp. MEBOG06 TaxID=2879938 RepID=UPI001F2C4FAB|nr:hypothetical protein [Chryseobacterium sp. MEBOG06]UKB82108.1 hypothetical protein LF887_13940 [Chryseobacterium sp. MEBOG06]
MKSNKVIEKIIAGINKNVKNKKWNCLYNGCSENAINSHILQKNGILNQIAPNGFIYEIKPKDVFKWENLGFNELTYFKHIGTSQAHSFPTFCNYHDTEIFKVIETHPIDFTNYKNNLLFAFRTLASFMRREEIILEKHKRLYNSNTIQAIPYNQGSQRITKEFIDLHEMLIHIRNKEHELFINDIENSEENFTFIEFNYPLKEVYSSTILSSPNLNSIYVNVFPYNSHTKILIFYLTKSEDKWTTEFVDGWKNLNETELEFKLTTYLLTKCENWGISETLYESIDSETENKIIESTQSVLKKQKIMLDNSFSLDFNIF